jgi:hypothetical protein
MPLFARILLLFFNNTAQSLELSLEHIQSAFVIIGFGYHRLRAAALFSLGGSEPFFHIVLDPS